MQVDLVKKNIQETPPHQGVVASGVISCDDGLAAVGAMDGPVAEELEAFKLNKLLGPTKGRDSDSVILAHFWEC